MIILVLIGLIVIALTVVPASTKPILESGNPLNYETGESGNPFRTWSSQRQRLGASVLLPFQFRYSVQNQ
jgi:hypothetical protein